MSEAFLTREQILGLLTELGDDLAGQGLRAELFIVGGAAMALAFNTRRTTRDIDGVYEPKRQVYETATRIGARHGLPEGWLNDAVKGLLPGPDPHLREILSAPGVRVSVPSPEYLLALKVAAARVDRDADDIRLLANEVGARTANDVLDITERVMGGRRPLLPKAQFLIEEMFAQPGAAPGGERQDAGERPRWERVRTWLASQRTAAKARAADRVARQAAAPPPPPKPPRAGRCGAPTKRGGRCRNRAGSCPNHR